MCNIPDMGAGSTISCKTAHIHQLLHLSCSWTHSPHCRKQGDSRAVLPSSHARGCCLHGSAETRITFSRLPFPAVTSPPTLGGLSQARDHLAPHFMEVSIFPQGSTKSLLTMRGEITDERTERHFPLQKQKQPPFTGCCPDAFQVHQDHF